MPILLTLVLSFFQAPAAAPRPDWAQFRNTPSLTGVASSGLPAAPKVRFTFDAGGAVESSAAIAGDTAFVGVSTGELIAIDLTTGKPRWRYRANDPNLGIGESSPAVAGGVVYIGDLSGVLHAVDVATGKAKWTFKTGAEIKSSPVISGNRVLIGSYDSHLYSIDAATGQQAWKLKTENYVHATPSIWNGVAYFGGCDEVFHGVRLTDGVEVVKLPVEAYTAASAAIVDGVAYFGTFANDVVAVDIAARKVKWRFEDPDRKFPYYSSAAIAGGWRCSAAATRTCARLISPPASRAGRSPHARVWNHRRPSPAIMWSSDRATARSTCWISRRARKSGSSNPAPPSPPRPRSAAVAS